MITAIHDDLIRQFCNDEKYKVTNNGKILTLVQRTGKVSVKNHWRAPSVRNKGDQYEYVRYHYKYLAVHRIVYQKYIGELDATLTINHIDGNPCNNHYSNLELISQAENNLHSFRVLKRKPSYGTAKINLDIAREIRALRQDGKKLKELCTLFNLSESSIYYIIHNKTWIENV